MNAKTAKHLRRLCIATSNGDLVSAEARYTSLKRNWDSTPAPARRGLMIALEKAASRMVGMMERAREAGRQAAAAEEREKEPSTPVPALT